MDGGACSLQNGAKGIWGEEEKGQDFRRDSEFSAAFE